MTGYIISCIMLGMIVLGFIPAMVAAHKDYSFVRWYFYGVLLFPVALIHSVRLKRAIRIINVHSSSSDNARKRRAYKLVFKKKRKINLSAKYICVVFAAKLVFGAFSAIIALAIMRTYLPDTFMLRMTCVWFALLLSVAMSITEIKRLSRIPAVADEITKRTLIIAELSAAPSVILRLTEWIILSNAQNYTEFFRFVCTVVSFILFLILLAKFQSYYYTKFYGFFDYCILSVFAYIVFAAVTLVLLSILKEGRFVVYMLSMPMHLFEFSYFSGFDYIERLSSIYTGSLVHFIVVAFILLSGLQCHNYRKRELAFRVEYRSKAFRMSGRQPLRRHIQNIGLNR